MSNRTYDDRDELPVVPRVDIPDADLVLLEREVHAIGTLRVEVVEGEGYVNMHFVNGSVVYS